MTDEDRRKLLARYEELERLLDDIRQGKVAEPEATELEAKCHREQDEIDYWLDVFDWRT